MQLYVPLLTLLAESLTMTSSIENTAQKTVLITGCSSGIGLCAAQTLQQKGYHVLASVRNSDDVSILQDQGIDCLHLDLCDEDSIDKAVHYIHEQQLNLYGLVNNGAYGQPGAVEDLSRQALLEQFETNVFGTHSLTQKLIPFFRQQQAGRIIQISSVLGFIGLPMRGAYNASKFALEGLSDTMRVELMGTNIHVSLIQPGPIESRFRPNAYLAFAKHIDADNSMYKDDYAQVYDRLNRTENSRFTLPASAVAKCILHALDNNKPKVRYKVTTPTKVMAVLKRLLPDRSLDKFIRKQGN